MLTTAKFTQFILGFLGFFYAVSAAFAQSALEAAVPLGIAIVSFVVFYLLQKYIAKNLTVIELKNYRLETYQAILGIFSIFQFISLLRDDRINSKIVHAILLILFVVLIIVIKKRIAENKREAT